MEQDGRAPKSALSRNMPFLETRRSASRWAILRLGAATLAAAALMNGVSGHFGTRIDQMRAEQIRVAQTHEAIGTVQDDLDSLLLGGHADKVGSDLDLLDEAMRKALRFDDPKSVDSLRSDYAAFVAAARRQIDLGRGGDLAHATRVNHQEVDAAYERVKSRLRILADLCEERAEAGKVTTYSVSFLTLLLSVGLATYFAHRYRRKADDFAGIAIRRHEVEAGERRLKIQSDLVEAEAAKREAEHQSQWTRTLLEAQIHSSVDGILIVDPQGKIVLQNRRMGEIWGIPDEILNNDDDARQIAYVLDSVKDPDAFVATVQELYANPLQTKHDEIELRNGKIIDRHTGPAVGPDGVVYGRVWTFRDVTDRVKAEKALRQSEAQLLGLMESIPQIVWSCRSNAWNLSFNHQWEAYTGQPPEESGGFGWHERIHPDDRGDLGYLSVERKTFEVENRLRGADGIYRWFLIRGIPVLNAQGRVDHWFGTCTDIDALKLSEELLRESQDELEKRIEQRTHELAAATQAAERANAAKSEFLSRMSHELRTPLNAILGFGQILQRQVAEPQRESVDYILKGGHHLLGLINEILDLARVESGRVELSIEPVPVAELLEESFAMVRNAAATAGIALETNLHLLEGIYVSADRQRLKQVFLNLLSNAVKYNQPEGRIAVRVHETAESLRIGIEDTGYGMSASDLAKLFTPFERLSAGSEIEGTGLGLFLTQKLVAAMGGQLDVQSQIGVGSTFSIELTRAKSPTEACALAGAGVEVPALREASDAGRAFTILSIEDNSANTRLLEKVVAIRPEIALTTATHGFEGLTLARQSEPDLILLDLNLPDLSGLDVLKRLRRSVTTAHIPVIVLTADASQGKAEAALAAGAHAFLTKPIDVELFLETLDVHIVSTPLAPEQVAA